MSYIDEGDHLADALICASGSTATPFREKKMMMLSTPTMERGLFHNVRGGGKSLSAMHVVLNKIRQLKIDARKMELLKSICNRRKDIAVILNDMDRKGATINEQFDYIRREIIGKRQKR